MEKVSEILKQKQYQSAKIFSKYFKKKYGSKTKKEFGGWLIK